MPYLRQAIDPSLARVDLLKALRKSVGGVEKVDLSAITVLRHKPGRRCVVEYSLEAEGRKFPATKFVLLGKSSTKGTDTATHDLHLTMWRSGFDAKSADGISVPRAMGLISEFRMWLQERVPGVSGVEAIAGADGVALARKVAEGAHKIHQLKLKFRREHTMADELRLLAERLALLSQQRPEWQERLSRVMAAARRLGERAPKNRLGAVHRDFYPAQVLADGDRVWLLDFDCFCLGDPALDPGNFIAHITEQSLRTTGSATTFADRELALRDRFVELAGPNVRATVDAYALLGLVRHVHVSTLIPERRDFTETLLALCEARLARWME